METIRGLFRQSSIIKPVEIGKNVAVKPSKRRILCGILQQIWESLKYLFCCRCFKTKKTDATTITSVSHVGTSTTENVNRSTQTHEGLKPTPGEALNILFALKQKHNEDEIIKKKRSDKLVMKEKPDPKTIRKYFDMKNTHL